MLPITLLKATKGMICGCLQTGNCFGAVPIVAFKLSAPILYLLGTCRHGWINSRERNINRVFFTTLWISTEYFPFHQESQAKMLNIQRPQCMESDWGQWRTYPPSWCLWDSTWMKAGWSTGPHPFEHLKFPPKAGHAHSVEGRLL